MLSDVSRLFASTQLKWHEFSIHFSWPRPFVSVGRSDGLGGFLVVKVALSFSVFLAVLVAECMYSVFLFVLFGYVVSAAYSSTR